MSTNPVAQTETGHINPLAPLRIAAYRNFWIAGLISNVGTWMHETGSVWLMTDLQPRPEMVSAVRVAMSIPVFCLALAAGVWADHFDRRKWLLCTQSLLLTLAATMWLLATWGWMSPWLLLLLTLGMGIALILNLPAWQALTPELVPAQLIPSAVQAGSVSFNLARTVGPALAGLAIAQFGVPITFLFNAVSFLGVLFVLLKWRPELAEPKRNKKIRFVDELRKGIFIIRNSPNIRHALVRVLLFAFCASAMWSLLSLVATERLGFRERGFGACLAALGIGAVLAAGVLPWLRYRLSSEQLTLCCQMLFAVSLAVIALTVSSLVVWPVLLLVGASWMTVMTTLNATAQVYLPKKFRARGMSAFVMSFSGGMGLGALVWGWVGKWLGLPGTFIAAAIAMALVTLLTHRLKLGPLHVELPPPELAIEE